MNTLCSSQSLPADVSRLLTIDIGNTAVKAALFEGEMLVRSAVCKELSALPVEQILAVSDVEGAVVCSVRGNADIVVAPLSRLGVPVVTLGPDTPLPISVCYDRRTIGPDRLAAACGVAAEGRAALIVDAGTAVTADLVAGLSLIGGNISPGLRLRFRSLNNFTSRLPLVEPDGTLPGFGTDTQTAIRAGVMRGLAAEILAEYNEARLNYNDLSLILTGGDAAILSPLLSEYGLKPVADSNAVGRGLVRIFNYNVSL